MSDIPIANIREPGLSVSFAGLHLRNPVIAASGSFGYGHEYAGLVDAGALGGICSKGLTLEPRAGNRGIRLHETPAGLINSIGLENPGIPAFIEKELPGLRALGTIVFANLSGGSLEAYEEGAALLDAAEGVDAILINPAAFTHTTGQAHWELLLRARAVENQCVVLAPAQGGLHENGRRTWGHTLIADAWGRVLAQRTEDGEGVVLAELDPAHLAQVRTQLPALRHRRL